MIRSVLFVLTNLAVLAVLSVVLRALELAGWMPPERSGPILLAAAVVGIVGSFVSLALSKRIARWSLGARVIRTPSNESERWLLAKIAELAAQRGIGTPVLALYDSRDLNALSTGMRSDHALLIVSSELVQSTHPDELEAVLAHEISHIASGDMVTLGLIEGVLDTFVIFPSRLVGGTLDRLLFRRSARRGREPAFWLSALITQLMFGVLATLIVMWFSRWREYRADAGAALLVGAGRMIRALERLQLAHEPVTLGESLRTFGIRGGTLPGWSRWFSSHPPLTDRIEVLTRGLEGWAAHRPSERPGR